MHGILGVINANANEVEIFRNRYERVFNVETEQFISKDGGAAAITSGDGPILGKWSEDGSFLLLLGCLYLPLPDWERGSPLDDADRTASFLMHRYRKRGKAFLDGTAGTYVVALWDDRSSRFFLGCDPDGFRTAFYSLSDNYFTFATTLYALNCVKQGGPDIDRSLEDFVLGYEFLPWQRTVYKGVFSLAPGTLLEVGLSEIRQHSIQKQDVSAYVLGHFIEDVRSEKQAQEGLYELFMHSMEQMLPKGRKKVAVLLGGFDSALVAAACRRLGLDVGTFTFWFENERLNQAYVEELAKHFGFEHHWVKITPELLREGLSDYPKYFNQPSGMPHYLIQTAHTLMKMQELGYEHCLTGDGCDEAFLGYPHVYRRAKLFAYLERIPKGIFKIPLGILRPRITEMILGQPARFIRNFIDIANRPMPRRGHISNCIMDGHTLKHLRREKYFQAIDSETVLAVLSAEVENLSLLRLAFHGKSMPGLNKAKQQGAASASGVTILSPFQHPALVAFGRSLPEEMLRSVSNKKGGAQGKRLLMEMADKKGLLPTDIIYQKKASPVKGMADFWYMGPLKGDLLNAFEKLPFDYDEAFAHRMLKPKLPEAIFRKKISIGEYVLNAPAMLATYAAFNTPLHCHGGNKT